MEAAASKKTGSVMSVAPPRYAATPTFSTTRAVAAIVATSVRTDEKSNEQLEETSVDTPSDWREVYVSNVVNAINHAYK